MRKSSNERLSGGSAGKTSADAPFTQKLILFLCGHVSKTSIPSALRRHSNNDWQNSRWPKLKKCSFICCTCPEPSKRTIATMSVSESVNCVPDHVTPPALPWWQGGDVSLTNWQRSFSICTLNALGHGGSSSMTQKCAEQVRHVEFPRLALPACWRVHQSPCRSWKHQLTTLVWCYVSRLECSMVPVYQVENRRSPLGVFSSHRLKKDFAPLDMGQIPK